MQREVRLHLPGVVPYRDAWLWQRQTAAAVRQGAPEALAVLQHPPVYTQGRRSRRENLLIHPETLALRGAELIQTDRGGDVTFHGFGQLVAYPILDLRARNLGPADYVRLLEETMLLTGQGFGVAAERSPGRPGIWADGAKLGAVGVRVQHGVSMHGLALNVDLDLSWFDAIVPCGLQGVSVTSMQRLLGHNPGIAAVEDAFIAVFERIFDSCSGRRAAASPSPRKERGLGGAVTSRAPEIVHGR
jgi:lipoyl(octanoyl) transferase